MAEWVCKVCGARYIGNSPGCPVCGSGLAYRVYYDTKTDKPSRFTIENGKKTSL